MIIYDPKTGNTYHMVDGHFRPLNDSHNFWGKLGGAFTDPDKRFEFPIKPFEMDLTQESKIIIVASAVILAGGLVLSAYIRAKK